MHQAGRRTRAVEELEGAGKELAGWLTTGNAPQSPGPGSQQMSFSEVRREDKVKGGN